MSIRLVLLATAASGAVVSSAGVLAEVALAQAAQPQTQPLTPRSAAEDSNIRVREPVRRLVPPTPRPVKSAPAANAAEPATAQPAATSLTAATPVPPMPAGTAPSVAVADSASWSPEVIAEAQAHCKAMLAGVEAITLPEDSIKHGQCGAPAVVKLMSIGRSPEVVLSPPAVVTCDMVAALHKWFKADVQRLARAHLGGSIVKIENMSAYSCRNAYGRRRTNLSEHGRANALDIGGFITASADATRVLTSWGMTARAVKELAAKAEAQKAAAAAAAGGLPKTSPPVVAGANGAARNTVVITGSTSPPASASNGHGMVAPPSAHGVIVRLPTQDLGGLSGFGLVAPSRLGGAKSTAVDGAAEAARSTTAAKPDPEAHRTRFLHEVHASACKHFGTVLGPEANNDHNNHFHVDMAPRKTGNFCE